MSGGYLTDWYRRWKGKSGARYVKGKKVVSGYPKTSYGKLNYRISRIEMGYGKEKKFHDYSASSSVGTTGSIGIVTGIAQGTDLNERIGNKIRITHMQYKVWSNQNASATASQRFRCVFFLDEQPNGGTPLNATVFQSDDVYSYKNMSNSHRFRLLRDLTFVLSDNPDASGGTQFRKGIVKFPRGLVVLYNNTGSTVTAAYQNHIFVYVVSDDNTNQVPYTIKCRMRFTDA